MTAPTTTQQPVYGQLSAFDLTKENISTYLEWAELFMEVNDVEDAKKVSVLLTVIRPKNYGIIRSLCAPARPARLQHWALVLSAYTYDIEFRPTDNADGLSRLPLT